MVSAGQFWEAGYMQLPPLEVSRRGELHLQEDSGIHKHVQLSQWDLAETSAWGLLYSNKWGCHSEIAESPGEPRGDGFCVSPLMCGRDESACALRCV